MKKIISFFKECGSAIILSMIVALVICVGLYSDKDTVKTTQKSVSEKVVEASEKKKTIAYGKLNLVKFDKHMYYEQDTKIVYFWNGHADGYEATTPSTYISKNGIPYQYDTETGGIIEQTIN